MGGAGSPTTTEFVKTNIEEEEEEDADEEEEGKKKKPRNVYGFSMENRIQDACGIPVEDTYVITGGYNTRTDVTMYNLTGNFWELPKLTTGRWSHGCGMYNREDQVVSEIFSWVKYFCYKVMFPDTGCCRRYGGGIRGSPVHGGSDPRRLGVLAVCRRPARPQGVPQLGPGRQLHLHLRGRERVRCGDAGVRGQARHHDVGAGPGGGGRGGRRLGRGRQDEDRQELPRDDKCPG